MSHGATARLRRAFAVIVLSLASLTAAAAASATTPAGHAGSHPVKFVPKPVATRAHGAHHLRRAGIHAAADWSVSLTASPTTLPVSGYTTLTATANADVGPTPYYIEIFDTTPNPARAAGYFPVVICGGGSTCTTQVTQSQASTHRYVAFVSGFSTAFAPPTIQATSSTSFVTWSGAGFQVSLYAPAWSNGNETVTAYANTDVGPTPYYIDIFDENGTLLQRCGTGTSCSVNFSPSLSGDDLVAFVANWTSSLPPSSVVASSNVAHTVTVIH
jgi:hypothetical protein